MKSLTLVIPAKNEEYSLPKILDELKKIKCKKLIVLSKKDFKTIRSIKNYRCQILKQKHDGYGNAIIEGINKVKTNYLCIFNADGSFDPKYLKSMIRKINSGNNFIFASRYSKNGGSEDDSFLTLVGNKIFTFIGNFFFNLKISDILFTYIIGETIKFKDLKLNNHDFRICVEIPIKIKLKKYKYDTITAYERKRLGGEKKVREFKDGWLIMLELIKSYFNKYGKKY